MEKISTIKKLKKYWFGKERKTRFGETNLNNRYFMRLIKKETQDFLSLHGEELKRTKPKVYYSMINRPLPKKYQKEEVVKPVEVKLTIPDPKRENELVLFQKKRELERKLEAEKIRNEQKSEVKLSFSIGRKDPNRGMRWINAFTPTNVGRLGHSQGFKFKKQKKYKYY